MLKEKIKKQDDKLKVLNGKIRDYANLFDHGNAQEKTEPEPHPIQSNNQIINELESK